MTKADSPKPNNGSHFLGHYRIPASVIIVMLVLFALAYIHVANLYSNLNSNYTLYKTQSQNQISTLQTQISILQTQLNSNKTLLLNMSKILLNMSKKYNTTEYNLTHAYVKVLLNDQIETIPPETLNYTDNTWYAPSYSFSFNATYPGYLIINFSVTPNKNNLKNSTLDIYVTTKKPYIQGGVPIVNSYVAPFSQYAGPNGSVKVPITNGTNYLEFTNFNNETVPIQLTITYVGFHTS